MTHVRAQPQRKAFNAATRPKPKAIKITVREQRKVKKSQLDIELDKLFHR